MTTQPEKLDLTLKSPYSQVVMDSVATPATTASLIGDVRKQVQSFIERKDDIALEREAKRKEHDKKMEEQRQLGSTALFEHLKNMVPEKVKTYAGYGRGEARLFEFTFGEECKFEGCYAKDLLTKGTVMKQLQDWLDAEHSEVVDGQLKRAFYTYFNMVGRPPHDRQRTKYAVFINWDQSTWENIQNRLENSRLHNPRPRDGDRRRRPREAEASAQETDGAETQETSEDQRQRRPNQKREQAPNDSQRNQPAPAEPRRNQPAQAEPRRNQSAQVEPRRNQPTQAEPRRNQSAQAEPRRNQPTQAEPRRNQPRERQGSDGGRPGNGGGGRSGNGDRRRGPGPRQSANVPMAHMEA